MEYSDFLGYYYGEEKLSFLIKALAIDETPVLPRGDTDTCLLKEAAGVELTFSDAESLKFPERGYPDTWLSTTVVKQ